jgi:integrase
MRDTLKVGSPERLLLSLYTYIPPVRADYFEVRINPPKSIIEDSKSNYIVLDNEKSALVLQDFKTAAKYKEIRHTLPPPLFQEIQQSLKDKPRNYLFVMQTDSTRPYDRGAFSKWANKVLSDLFKIPMTLTSLRHLFISTLDFNKTRASELEKIGNSMGHSISMQKGYQWIDSKV